MIARRGWAWPLVPLYAAVLAMKDALRTAGVLRTRTLAWPVVSIGSLSAGGAGKTPVVIALVELLKEHGWGVDVLSRGYGRAGSSVERVNAAVENAASQFGDEPVLIAQRTGVPVWVGADRYVAGVATEAATEKDKYGDSEPAAQNDGFQTGEARSLHLLDDGFQHRGLARGLDVVLVTEEDLQDALLPAGNRREPLRALRRADVVVLREDERGRIEQRVRQWMRGDAAVWTARRKLQFIATGQSEPQRTRSKGENTEVLCVGRRMVAFCGIARPGGFWAGLAAAGCEIAGKVAFGDHHKFTRADMKRLIQEADKCGASEFVTTEKDAVKLASDWELMAELEAVGPVVVARLDAIFVDEVAVLRDIESKIGEARLG